MSETMLDEFAIQKLLNTYSEAATRRDWDRVLSCYHEDGIWAVPSLSVKFEGHAKLREGLNAMSAPYDYIAQLSAPAVIEVTGDTATARSVVRECAKVAGQQVTLEVLMFYVDKLTRTANGWRFLQRSSEVIGLHQYALLPMAH